MTDATESGLDVPQVTDWQGQAFDLIRGIAVYTGNRLIGRLAKVIARHPDADVANAFNRKQVACKLWARDQLLANLGNRFGAIWILGGWYGVLAAIILDDPRFEVGTITSVDIDPAVAPIAQTLIGGVGDQFHAVTRDMYALDYRTARPDLVINTSCEHIASLQGWLGLLPPGTRVLLQSNDYFSEPTHINCMRSLAEFAAAAKLSEVVFSGELPQPNYTRFMLIGRV
jgi:hypothetical protein